jgi:hypothetical protein
LLLFMLLVSFFHVTYLPYLWRHVEADVRKLASGSEEGADSEALLALWSGVWLGFLMWFFDTPAGRHFVDGRPLVTRQLDAGWRLGSGVLLCAMVVAVNSLSERVKTRGGDRTKTRPFPTRGLLELWAGGGIFVRKSDQGRKAEEPSGSFGASVIIALLLQLCYWRWSAASLALMYCLVSSAAVLECVRMCFVYVHHKRVFG